MRLLRSILPALLITASVFAPAQSPSNLASPEMSGNPVLKGWYADPEAIIYGNQYWIFPTYSDDVSHSPANVVQQTAKQKLAINPQYLKQTFFDAFSSPDLVRHREVCIDEMKFNPDGTIQPVRITVEGVKARPIP